MGQKFDALRSNVDHALRTVDEAVRHGQVSPDQAASLRGILLSGIEDATPAAPADREMTITLRVSGRAGAIPAEAGREIERALAPLASRVGVTITSGSVRVS